MASARAGLGNHFALCQVLQESMEGLDRQEVAPHRAADMLTVLLGL